MRKPLLGLTLGCALGLLFAAAWPTGAQSLPQMLGFGRTAGGVNVPLLVDSQGRLATSGGGGTLTAPTITRTGGTGGISFPNILSVQPWILTVTTVDVPTTVSTTGIGVALVGDCVIDDSCRLVTNDVTIGSPNLSAVQGSLHIAVTNDTLTAASFPALTVVGLHLDLYECSVLTSVDFSALTTVGGEIAMGTNGALTSIALPALTTVGVGVTITSNTTMTTLDLSNIVTAGNGFNLYGNPVLVSVDLSHLRSTGVGDLDFNNDTLLTTVTLTSALKSIGGEVLMQNTALNVATVNAVLVRLAALNGTGGTTSYDNHTIDLSGGSSASPSGVGLIAKTTLEGRGNTVTVN